MSCSSSPILKEGGEQRKDGHTQGMSWTQPRRTKTVMEMMSDLEFLFCFANSPQNRWMEYPSDHTLNWWLSTAIQSVVFIFSSPQQERWGEERTPPPTTDIEQGGLERERDFLSYLAIFVSSTIFCVPSFLLRASYGTVGFFFPLSKSKLIHMILNAQNTAETLLFSVKCT